MHSNETFFLWYKIEAIFNKLIICIYTTDRKPNQKDYDNFENDLKII